MTQQERKVSAVGCAPSKLVIVVGPTIGFPGACRLVLVDSDDHDNQTTAWLSHADAIWLSQTLTFAVSQIPEEKRK